MYNNNSVAYLQKNSHPFLVSFTVYELGAGGNGYLSNYGVRSFPWKAKLEFGKSSRDTKMANQQRCKTDIDGCGFPPPGR